MIDAVRPVETEFAENKFEYLEMIILLVSYHIYEFVKRVLGETLFSGSDVLGHIYRCPVPTEKKFPVKSVSGKVTPYRAVFLSFKNSLLKSLLHESLSEKIGL